MVIQLFINSMYGKTIIKPVETDTIVKDNTYDLDKYTSYNYNYIDSVIEANGTYYIEQINTNFYHILIMFIVELRF